MCDSMWTGKTGLPGVRRQMPIVQLLYQRSFDGSQAVVPEKICYERNHYHRRMSDAQHKEQCNGARRLRRDAPTARASEGALEAPGTSPHPHSETLLAFIWRDALASSC